MVQPLRPIHQLSHENRSFIRYSYITTSIKQEVKIIMNWIVQKQKYNKVVINKESFYYLEVMFHIIWSEEKFPDLVQKIDNTTYASICEISLTGTKRPGKILYYILT